MAQRIPPHHLPTTHPRHIPTHSPIPTLLHSPRALQPPHLDLNLHPRTQPPRRNNDRIQPLLRKKSSRSTPQPTIEKHLEDTPINDALEPKRPRIGINQVRDREFIREEGVVVVEAANVAAVEPEGGVAAEVHPAAERFAGGGGEESEVCGAGGVDEGDVGCGEGEVERAGGDGGAVVVQEAGVRGGGVRERGFGGVERGEIVGDREQRVRCPGRVR